MTAETDKTERGPVRRWVQAAANALSSYEIDYGERLPDDHELGRIDDSRVSPSFRIRAGHIRQLCALLGNTHEQASAEPLTFVYRNWRGETATRRVIPQHVYFGPTEWHPEPQWMMRAIDVDKDEVRDFAMQDMGPRPASAGKVEPVAWPNGCDKTAIAALRYLSTHERPEGGEQLYNSIHLEQIAGELEAFSKRPLYVAPPTHPDARQAAEEMRERCANALRDWRTRPNDCESLGFMDPETGARECALEVRGRDCICDAQAEAVEEIERVIRTLPLPGDKVEG